MRLGKRLLCLSLCLIMLLPLSACGLVEDYIAETLTELKYTASHPYDFRSDAISFDEMEYKRPDVERIKRLGTDIKRAAKSVFRIKDTLKALDEFRLLVDEFETMSKLAQLHSDMDTESEYWAQENSFCSESWGGVFNCYDEVLLACSNSPLCSVYDGSYFGGLLAEGYSVTDNTGYTPTAELAELYRHEAELENDYFELLNKLEAHEEPPFAEYYEDMANIYIELIKTRSDIAEKTNYKGGYLEYAYDSYQREYSAEDCAELERAIKEQLAPLYRSEIKKGLGIRGYDEEAAESSFELVTDTLRGLNSELDAALDFMLKYRLYDVSQSDKKRSGSYVCYLPLYASPFMLVSPEGYDDDALGIAHELGHFAERYINRDDNRDNDSIELFSQGMEYLMLANLESKSKKRVLTRYQLLENLGIYCGQMCYNEFEERAFSMPEEELSPESLRELYEGLVEEYGFTKLCGDNPGMEWIGVEHLFAYPFYVISYCVSNTAAFRLYEMELNEKGSGLDCYMKMLKDANERSFSDLIEAAGLPSPLSEDTIIELAETLKTKLKG